MPLKIISWNCLNLSNYLNLDNPTMTLDERCDFIAQLINNEQPDITIIMEAGQDGGVVAEKIKNYLNSKTPPGSGTAINHFDYDLSDFVYSGDHPNVHNAETRIETYIAIINTKTASIANETLLDVDPFPSIGPPQIIFRGAWFLEIRLSPASTFYIIAMHAPNPSYHIDVRSNAIQNVLQNLNQFPQAVASNIIFLGDFNFIYAELGSLKAVMNASNFVWAGPAIDRNTNQPIPCPNNNCEPANTSLKSPIKQIKLNQPTHQPYDQFWMYNPPPSYETEAYTNIGMGENDNSLKRIVRSQINVLHDVNDKLNGWIADNYLPSNGILNLYNNAELSFGTLQTFFNNNQKSLKELEPIDKNLLNDLYNSIVGISANIGSLYYNGQLPDNSPTRSVLGKINNASEIIFSFLNIKMTGGTEGVDQLNQAIYRIAFSDHVPIRLIIH